MLTVYVLDDDEPIGEALRYLLETAGYRVERYRLADSFLKRSSFDRPACLLLDLRLSDRSGLEVRRALLARGVDLPTIMISGRAEIPDAVQAVKDGVLDFLTKPFDDALLLARVKDALAIDEENLRKHSELESLRRRFAGLTAREQEVMRLVVAGQANKQIASQLNLSMKTVEFHRKNVMEKIEVDSVTELVRLALVAFPDFRTIHGS